MFILSPRYRLDDELPWLEGIDPARYYWIAVNGNTNFKVAISGLVVSSVTELKAKMRQWRELQPGEQMFLERIANTSIIYCIGENCFAIEGEVQGAQVWHLFDYETLESLLMTSHPEWQCAPKDIELGRQQLAISWQQGPDIAKMLPAAKYN